MPDRLESTPLSAGLPALACRLRSDTLKNAVGKAGHAGRGV